MPTGRLGGLDRLRGAALVLMLVHHLTDWLGRDARAVLPGWPQFAVTDVAAPAFTVALGASVPLLVRSRRRRGASTPALARTTLRRYGLLVPIGVGLRAALGFDLDRVGVLETLGLCALAVAAVVVATRPAVRVVLAVGVLAVAPAVEQAAQQRTDWVSTHLLTGIFPFVTYLGFALVGAAVVPALQSGMRRAPAALVGAVLLVWSVVLAFGGQVPDRYPTTAAFVVPGLAGTVVLYLLVTSPRLTATSAGRALSSLVERAGAHTFGVFVGHYVVYFVLQRTGWLHVLAPGAGLAVAVALTAAFVLAAPRVPQLPWSPRTGWNRPRPSPAPAALVDPERPLVTTRRG